MLRSLATVAQAIDAINERIGRGVAWLALAMVLVQVTVVAMRYVFGLSILAMQESIWYMHAVIFLVAAGYTLLHNAHVRVDIIYGNVGPRTRAKIDLIGTFAILLPVCVMIWIVSWPYIIASWEVREGSAEVSGVQGVYLVKTCILIFAATSAVQGISLAIRSLLILLEPEGEGPEGEGPDGGTEDGTQPAALNQDYGA